MHTRTATQLVSLTITPIFLSLLLVLACSHRQAESEPSWPGKVAAVTPAPIKAAAAPVVAAPAKKTVQATAAKSAKKPVVAAKTGAKPGPAASTMTLVATVVGKKVTMFVAAATLNVRASPNQVAPVVGKLTRGSMFNVTVRGGWAKIGDGQYVSTRYLSAAQPPATRAKLASK